MSIGRGKFSLRNRYFLILDVLIFVVAAVSSYMLRLETANLTPQLSGIIFFLVIAVPIKMIVFFAYGMYRTYWEDASAGELILLMSACMVSSGIIIAIVFAVSLLWPFYKEGFVPRSVPFIDALITAIAIAIVRFSLRAYNDVYVRRRHQNHASQNEVKRALIIGAGRTGIQVFDSLRGVANQIIPVGFLDDDPHKVGTFVRGVKVHGKIKDLPPTVRSLDIDLVVIALPSAPGKVIRKIAMDCTEINVEHRIMPDLYGLVSGQTSVNMLRPVSIEDLLRRTPIALDTNDIKERLKGQCVMVTGAGGSIGSELSRQIAGCNPSQLLLVGRGENSLFAIEHKLKNEYPHLAIQMVLSDVRNLARLDSVFEEYRPRFVFHAAAHKHVPMLESNVVEAVTNNVMGTQNLIDLCNRYEVSRMVLVSTDKAVNPTNVMGMTKRTCEMLMMSAEHEHPGRFAAVRFGNVLGSRGSVVPTFQGQIAAGGPVTVTSSEMTRFFMSIPEAVLLVLKASALQDRGPLFVLNMGEPVRIMDLAEDLIRLSGLEPGRDIDVKVTGVRPGEKLYEELFWDFEAYQPVEKGTIFAMQLTKEQARYIAVEAPRRIRALIQAAQEADEDTVRANLRDVVFSMADLDKKLMTQDLNAISAGASTSAQMAGQSPLTSGSAA
jgi:FlaA1/EpsC-like NDP-sugar epimerase